MDSMAHVIIGDKSHSLDRLMKSAEAGQLDKHELAELLASHSRPAFLEACEAIEKRIRADCAATGDPCLSDGCAIESDETCLQAVLKTGPDYQKACGAVWIELFRDPRNRNESWA